MARNRVNMLPVNWWAVLICCFIAFLIGEQYMDAVNNGRTPAKISAGQFPKLVSAGGNHKYLSITGEIHPEFSMNVTEGRGDDTKAQLVPMVDPKTQTGLFIRTSPGFFSGDKPGVATVTGMVWGVESDLRGALPEEASRVSGRFPKPVNFETGVWLSEGRAPGKPESALAGMGAALGIGFLFLLPILIRYVVFQRTGKIQMGSVTPFSNSRALADKDKAQTDVQVAGLRLTGKLRLHEKCAMRFLDVPGHVTLLQGGQLAFVSNIDASPRENGQVTERKMGLWLLVPRLSTLSWEEGRLYNGFRGRPAVRLRYEDELQKGRKSKAILSFETEAQREALVRELSKNKL